VHRAIILALLLFHATAHGAAGVTGHAQEQTMIERDGLRLDLQVRDNPVRTADHLVLEADFTNIGTAPLHLDARFLAAASLVLRVQRVETPGHEIPVPLGPPPMPPARDDRSGLRALAPGEVLHMVWRGAQMFSGRVLPVGDYNVRLVYNKTTSPPDEWHGLLETGTLPFRVDPS
jgi:hypothetical protein